MFLIDNIFLLIILSNIHIATDLYNYALDRPTCLVLNDSLYYSTLCLT